MTKYWAGLIFLLLMQAGLFAQVIKKMKADELNEYIIKSETPLVVSFWATWCGSCNEEIPYFIAQIKEKYKDKVALLLVSLDIKSYYPNRIASFAAKRKYDVPIVWLNETDADVFCPKIDTTWSGAIPSTLMVNNKTQYRKFYEVGLSPAQFEKNLEQLLAISF